MADEGEDFGYCLECGVFGKVQYVYPHEGMRCDLHVPIVDKEAFDMIFEKAGVPHQNQHRPWQSILGILAFSKKHRQQAMQEIES